MLQLIENFGQQLHDSLEIAAKATLTKSNNNITNVLVAGMGGSGIGGSLVQSFTSDSLTVPLTVVQDYTIPAFVSKNTLFIACSFSGNTEETLSCLEQGHKQGAKIVCITSGGKIGAYAKKHGFDVISIPGESKSPRASIGYSFVQLLKILNFFDLTGSDYKNELAAAANLIQKEANDIKSQAKAMAADIKGHLPVLYGDTRLGPVLLRTQQQINENGKQLCHINTYPEMNHNELVGWEYPADLLKKTVVIFMLSSYDNPRTRTRLKITEEIYNDKAGKLIQKEAKGDSFVEQAIYLTHLFDWVSFYVAEENGADPFPVKVIDYLKSELAKS